MAKTKTNTKTKENHEVPPFGEKTCEDCGCQMAGPGVNADTQCAEIEKHACADCKGTGRFPNTETTCKLCDGSGK